MMSVTGKMALLAVYTGTANWVIKTGWGRHEQRRSAKITKGGRTKKNRLIGKSRSYTHSKKAI